MDTMGGFDNAVETAALPQIGRSEIRQAISNFFLGGIIGFNPLPANVENMVSSE